MSTGTGISAQLGVAAEGTYGQPVVVSRFYDFVNETLKLSSERTESKGLRSGLRVLRSSRWGAGKRKVTGDVNLELGTKNFGLIFAHALGSVATTQPAVGTDPTVYDHTATPADLTGKMLTVQVGKPDSGGTVRAFTYQGVKVAGWELGCKVGEIGMLKLSLWGQDEVVGGTLATPSYPSGDQLFYFTQGTITIGGVAYPVQDVNVTGKNPISEDRYFLGSAVSSQPIEEDWREYLVDIGSEFIDATAYNRFVSGTEAALVLLFQGATISGIYKYQLQVTMNVRFDGDTPVVDGPKILSQPLKAKALNSGAGDGSAITVVYRTTDVTP